MAHKVFNNSFGSQYSFGFPKISEEQERQIIAGLFEQLMVFDKVTISTNRINSSLTILIKKLGINTVERLIDNDYIELLLWTPVIVTGTGRENKDGSIDESTIYGKPPIAAGSLTEQDTDPERNVNIALSNFDFNRERRRIFVKRAAKKYIIPSGMELSKDSAKMVIDSYKRNLLSELGLPYNKEPELFNLDERFRLLELGHKILETAILAEYSLKSFNNYEHYKIIENSISHIGKAYRTTENFTRILSIEKIPDLKNLFLENKLDFDSIFKLRHLQSAKYFRKWINSVDESTSSEDITYEYIKEIKGHQKFFNWPEGKFIRTVGIFALNLGLGKLLASLGIGSGLEQGLGMLDTFILEKILLGSNPSIYIDQIKNTILTE